GVLRRRRRQRAARAGSRSARAGRGARGGRRGAGEVLSGWLEGEAALVTGGAAGIGRAVVRRYVEEGARVCVVDVDEERLAALGEELGDAAVTVNADVTEYENNARAVAAAVDAFGKLDVFVANAGRGDAFRELIDIPPENLAAAYYDIFDVNVKAVILGAR